MTHFRSGAHIALTFLLSVTLSPLALAQSPLAERGPVVEVDSGCALSPQALEVDGQPIVVWHRYDNGGIWARTGARLDALGAEVALAPDHASGSLRVAPVPGGFVVAWVTEEWPSSHVKFQRFGLDLQPLGPAVLVGTTIHWHQVALSADAGGVLTLAWIHQGTLVKARRYSSTDTPLTPEIDVQATWSTEFVSVAVGDAGFLVGWSELPNPPDANLARARAYSLAGAPLGGLVELGQGRFMELAAVDGGYLVIKTYDQADLYAWRLGEDGQPIAGETPLGLATEASRSRVARGPAGLWLAWETELQIFGSLLDPETLVATAPEALASIAPSDHLVLAGLEPQDDGVLLGWQVGFYPPILPHPCFAGRSAYTRAFGPSRGTLDVPTLSPAGVLISVLLIAGAGLLIVRRGL